MKTRQEKYFVVDMYAHGAEHSLINKSFIQYFNDKNAVFLLNNVHAKFVSEHAKKITFLLSDVNLKNRYFRLINREILKLLFFIFFIPYIYFSNRKLCILAASNIQMYVLSWLTWLNPHIVVHGQAEIIVNKKVKSLPSKLFKKAFYTFTRKNIKLLFLSKHISNNLPTNNSYYFIKHPLPSDIQTHTTEQNRTDKLKIAMVGLIRNDKKNCNAIYDLEVGDNIELWVIGRAHRDFQVRKNTKIKFKLWDSVYTDDEFLESIKDIDGFLYLFDKDQYRMTASATALDAIIHGKMVFTIKNEAIESLLEEYPNVVVANDIKELEYKINDFQNYTSFTKFSIQELLSKYCLTGNDNTDVLILEKWLS